jgi:hypothetical protein
MTKKTFSPETALGTLDDVMLALEEFLEFSNLTPKQSDNLWEIVSCLYEVERTLTKLINRRAK